MSSTTETRGDLAALLEAGRAKQNFVFGLVVGGVVAAGLYYTRVISPEETVADPWFFLLLGVVLGVSIAFLIAFVLSAVTLYKLGTAPDGH